MYVSGSGNDANVPFTSVASPARTIQKVIDFITNWTVPVVI